MSRCPPRAVLPGRLLFGLLALSCLGSGSALAANWERAATVDVGSEYNDNRLLRATDQIAGASYNVVLRTRLQRETARNQLDLNLSGRYLHYQDSALDALGDGGLTIGFNRQYPRSLANAAAGVSVRSSLLTGFDEDGFIGQADRQLFRFAILGHLHEWGPRTRSSVRMQFDDLEVLEQDPRFQRADQRSGVLRGSVDYQLSPRLRMQLGASIERRESEQPGSLLLGPVVVPVVTEREFTLVGPSLGLEYEVSSRIVVGASVGAVRNDSRITSRSPLGSNAFEDADIEYFGGLTANRELRRGSVSLSLDRSNRSGAAGEFINRDRIGLTWVYDLTARSRFRLGVDGFRDQRDLSGSDRVGASASAALVTELAEPRRLTLAYTFRNQEIDAVPRAEGHSISIVISHDFR